MVGFYELRTMNHGLSLGFRCGVPPRQIHDGITTVCRPLYIPAMPRIHGGTPATAVRSGSRPAPPDSRYLADQKGSGRPLRYRIQAMGEKEVTDCKKNTRTTTLCVGAVPSLFGPSGAERREVQDGCQNGQLWLGSLL